MIKKLMLLNMYSMNTTQKKPTLKKMKKTILLCSLFMAMSFTIHAQQPRYDIDTLFYGEEIKNTDNEIHQMNLFYNKSDYFDDAKFLKKGQVDPDNNFKVKADCYNLPINKLKYKEGLDG